MLRHCLNFTNFHRWGRLVWENMEKVPLVTFQEAAKAKEGSLNYSSPEDKVHRHSMTSTLFLTCDRMVGVDQTQKLLSLKHWTLSVNFWKSFSIKVWLTSRVNRSQSQWHVGALGLKLHLMTRLFPLWSYFLQVILDHVILYTIFFSVPGGSKDTLLSLIIACYMFYFHLMWVGLLMKDVHEIT